MPGSEAPECLDEPTAPRPNAHHALVAHEVVLPETDADHGPSTEEAARRLERFGPHVLPPAAGGGLLWRVLRQFHHPA